MKKELPGVYLFTRKKVVLPGNTPPLLKAYILFEYCFSMYSDEAGTETTLLQVRQNIVAAKNVGAQHLSHC